MKYLCLTVRGGLALEAALKEYAALDWRLHTLTLLRADVAITPGADNIWHVVMEKGTF
jgi:hypothetical protein